MADIVVRLRKAPQVLLNVGPNAEQLMYDAADEIVRLRNELRRPSASDVDPTAGLNPNFKWDSDG